MNNTTTATSELLDITTMPSPDNNDTGVPRGFYINAPPSENSLLFGLAVAFDISSALVLSSLAYIMYHRFAIDHPFYAIIFNNVIYASVISFLTPLILIVFKDFPHVLKVFAILMMSVHQLNIFAWMVIAIVRYYLLVTITVSSDDNTAAAEQVNMKRIKVIALCSVWLMFLIPLLIDIAIIFVFPGNFLWRILVLHVTLILLPVLISAIIQLQMDRKLKARIKPSVDEETATNDEKCPTENENSEDTGIAGEGQVKQEAAADVPNHVGNHDPVCAETEKSASRHHMLDKVTKIMATKKRLSTRSSKYSLPPRNKEEESGNTLKKYCDHTQTAAMGKDQGSRKKSVRKQKGNNQNVDFDAIDVISMDDVVLDITDEVNHTQTDGKYKTVDAAEHCTTAGPPSPKRNNFFLQDDPNVRKCIQNSMNLKEHRAFRRAHVIHVIVYVLLLSIRVCLDLIPRSLTYAALVVSLFALSKPIVIFLVILNFKVIRNAIREAMSRLVVDITTFVFQFI